MAAGCVCQKRAVCLLPRWFRLEPLEALDREHLPTAPRHPSPKNQARSRLTLTPLFSLVFRFSKDLVLNGCPKEPAQRHTLLL